MNHSLDAERLDDGAALMRALGHGVRLTLLAALVEGERSVGEIESLTRIGQPGLSQQLAILRKADLVTTRREAKLVYYSINAARLAGLGTLIHALRGPEGAKARFLSPVNPVIGAGAAMRARVI